jgi:hypothetical protein
MLDAGDEKTPFTSEKDVAGDHAPAAASAVAVSDFDGPASSSNRTGSTAFDPADPLNYARMRKDDVSKAQMKKEHPDGNKRKLKKYYTRQNELIDQFLGAGDEERAGIAEDIKMGPKIRFAVNASFGVNFCLFVIQLYAAVSTGSLSVWHSPHVHIAITRHHLLTRFGLVTALCYRSRCLRKYMVIPLNSTTPLLTDE